MRGVVSAPICPLFLTPEAGSERSDELLTGWEVDLRSVPAPGWYEVCTDYGYPGFAPAECLTTSPAEPWERGRKRTVSRATCPLLAGPSVQAPLVARLLRGASIALLGPPQGDGWQAAVLPDGREGFLKETFLCEVPATPLPEELFRRRVAAWAGSYLGTAYLWGGKSPLGIDCSGLTFMAYRLSGVTIYRDAKLHPDYPIRAISLEQADTGDLLYFPGHVALCLPGGAYIHATAKSGSDGVVINSLDPNSPLYRPDLPSQLLCVGSLFSK